MPAQHPDLLEPTSYKSDQFFLVGHALRGSLVVAPTLFNTA